MVLVVESGLFGLFVTAIMCDQLQAIFGDETAVEQAKQQGPYRFVIYLLYIMLILLLHHIILFASMENSYLLMIIIAISILLHLDIGSNFSLICSFSYKINWNIFNHFQFKFTQFITCSYTINQMINCLR